MNAHDQEYQADIAALITRLEDFKAYRVIDATHTCKEAPGIKYKVQWIYTTCTGKTHIGRVQDAAFECPVTTSWGDIALKQRLIQEYWDRELAPSASIRDLGKRPLVDSDPRQAICSCRRFWVTSTRLD